MALQIREVTLQDIPILQHIATQTFIDTYAIYNSEENMHNYIKDHFSEAQLTLDINNSLVDFYFASIDEDIIGYIKINIGTAQTELKDQDSLEIERIYVLQSYQGKGIGQQLCHKAIDLGRQHGVAYVWLGVWDQNLKAIKFYEKNGFKIFDTHIYTLGDDPQTDYMMKFEIKKT
jgi:ribosomal protein S18 acetylase RimI-like enzyme